MPGPLSEQEFNAVLDRVAQAAPKGLSEAQFNALLDAEVARAEGAGPQGSATSRFLSNAGAMLNPVTAIEGLYQAARHPVDTVSAIASASKEQGRKASDMFDQGRYSEAAGHALGVFPVIGPMAANIGEQAAGGDIAGAAGATAGLLAPFGVKPAFNAARGVVGAGGRAVAAGALERGAAERVADVMAPKVGANKVRFGNQAAKVAPDLAKNPEMAAWSRSGLQARVEQGLEEAKAALDDAADTRNAGKPYDTRPILATMRSARARLVAEPFEAEHPVPQFAGEGGAYPKQGGRPVSNPRMVRDVDSGQMKPLPEREGVPLGKSVEPSPNAPRIAALDQMIAEVEALGPQAPFESLRRVRQAWDSVAKTVYSPSMTQDFLKLKGQALGAADGTAALREALAKGDPVTAAANADFTLYKTASDVLKATEETERARPKVGRAIVARWGATVGGAHAAGAPGAAIGFVLGPSVEAALSMGLTTKLQTARMMSRLAGAIRAGDVNASVSLMQRLRKLAPGASVTVDRLTSPSESPNRNTAPGWSTP